MRSPSDGLALTLNTLIFLVVGHLAKQVLPSQAELTTLDGVKVKGLAPPLTRFNASSIRVGRLHRPVHRDEVREEGERAEQAPYMEDGYVRKPIRKPHKKKRPRPFGKLPKARPPLDLKKEVGWYEDSHVYALKASIDSRILIRHAQIPAAGSPWPLPQHYDPDTQVFLVRENTFQFHASGENCDILRFAFKRTRKNIFGESPTSQFYARVTGDRELREIRFMNVTVLKECPKLPGLDMDESYDLEVKKSGASIIAREIWGALRGLETFSQLVYQDDHDRYVVNRTFINDFPRFAHRGILLDTARHFLKKEVIIENLEAMAQNKMNVFHWHIVDDQSFPFQSKAFPNITRMGSFDPVTHIYTHEDIAEIIDQARLRGIRVIAEFDTPGHTLSWGFGQDHLLTACYDYMRKPNGLYGPVNPILKSTYHVMAKLFREVLNTFPDKYVHLGGDEVPFDCWQTNPQIAQFMKRNNITDIKDILGLYERKLLDILTQLGKLRKTGSGYIVWQEVVDNGVKVKPDTIVQIWMGDVGDIERITNMGLRAIYSTCWYLDYINYGQDWDKYYKCENIGQYLEEYHIRNEHLLIGGEACLWTEYADSETVLSRLWPRASAAAERLWSNKNVKDAEAAAPRIEEQRCRMLRRGLKVGVLSGPGYCKEQRKSKTAAKPNNFFRFWKDDDLGEAGQKWKYAKNIYVVDMNAMYLVPLLVVVCICCLTLLSTLQDSKSKIVAILTYPVSPNKRSVRGLLFVFLGFAFLWCVWTAPIWMHVWENNNASERQHTSAKEW